VKVLVTGGAGYLGSELCRQAVERGFEVVATQHVTPAPYGRPVRLDARDEGMVQRVLTKHRPDLVIHTAYVQSGPAMHETIVRGSRFVAEAAHRVGARLVHFSTDLVFDGEHGAPYREDAEPRPVMAYGAAKLESERLVAHVHPGALLVRTSLLYGKPEPGPQELLAFRDDVDFFTDEIRCPTRVDELASALFALASTETAGVLHVAAPDAVSRAELARLLRAAHGFDPSSVRGVPSPRTGRARNVALDSTLAAQILGGPLPGALPA
jgi:dTDP-4-dehydrorhamnose reductase